MATFRRRLRLFAVSWLVFQLSWLTALVPGDCCAAHRPAAKKCHESPATTFCPMRGVSGQPCPMHREVAEDAARQTASAHHHGAASAPSGAQTAVTEQDHGASRSDCRLTGGCGGPMSALFTLLSTHGVLPEPTATVPTFVTRHIAVMSTVDAAGRFPPPDPPPPRA